MGWSIQAADFINKLIQRKPTNRLGLNGPSELKSHPWLKDVDWSELSELKTVPPYIPTNSDYNIDTRNIGENWKDDEQEMNRNMKLLKEPVTQLLFKEYFYSAANTNSTSSGTGVQSTGDEKPTIKPAALSTKNSVI
jgi:serum/glucocorticoid-regulated kinase 2